MRRAAVPCLWPALWGLTLITSGSGAQGLHRAAFAASATVGTQTPSYAPLSAPDLLGLGVSVEALAQHALSARVAVTALRSVSIRDDLSVCIVPERPWDLDTNCLSRTMRHGMASSAATCCGGRTALGQCMALPAAGGHWSQRGRTCGVFLPLRVYPAAVRSGASAPVWRWAGARGRRGWSWPRVSLLRASAPPNASTHYSSGCAKYAPMVYA